MDTSSYTLGYTLVPPYLFCCLNYFAFGHWNSCLLCPFDAGNFFFFFFEYFLTFWHYKILQTLEFWVPATSKTCLPTCEEHLFLLRKQNSIKPMRFQSCQFQSSTWISGSQSLVLGPAAAAAPGNWLDMHIPWSLSLMNPTLGLGPSSLCFITPRWFSCTLKVQNHQVRPHEFYEWYHKEKLSGSFGYV